MPWFQTPAISGYWGYHWTENRFNPDIIVDPETGRRQIASHFYPTIGPYDSADPAVIRYHLGLMEYAGISGLIIDWYGFRDINDYGQIHRSVELLISILESEFPSLEFAIMYESRTIQSLIDLGIIAPNEAVQEAQSVMLRLEREWFGSNNYAKLNGEPLLMTFGDPPEVFQPSEWPLIFSVLNVHPAFFTQNRRNAQANARGGYGWVYPTLDIANSEEIVRNTLELFYGEWNPQPDALTIGPAFPGFFDIYETSYGFVDSQWADGPTFQQTLQMALANSTAGIVQLVTWNDFEEGTVIEPTLEFGYGYLDMVKAFVESQKPKKP
uniref:Glycosyl hydrolase family 71 n=1 Tax=Hirondellea gigas TaxID=1518452 RepID=A0A6A7G9U7_9CRUS